MKVYKDNFAEAIEIASKISEKISFVRENASNLRNYLEFEKAYKAKDNDNEINYNVFLKLYMQDNLTEIINGEELENSLADIQICLFPPKSGIALSQIYTIYTKKYLEEKLKTLLEYLNKPVYLESEKYGSGYGFAPFDDNNNMYIFYRDNGEVFKNAESINKQWFQKIKKLIIE